MSPEVIESFEKGFVGFQILFLVFLFIFMSNLFDGVVHSVVIRGKAF